MTRTLVILVMLLSASAAAQTCWICGDVDGDGIITAWDASLALQIASSVYDPLPRQIRAADVDCDGVVTRADAMAILRHAVAGDPTAPIQGCCRHERQRPSKDY